MRNAAVSALLLPFLAANALVPSSRAHEAQGSAFFWDEGHRDLVRKTVLLPDLKDPGFLESERIRVVHARSPDPIAIDSTPLSIKAQNVYYHARFALDFLHPYRSTADQGPLVIRIEMPNEFSDSSHWHSDEKRFRANNALSVPASTSFKAKDVPAWGKEIWFRPYRSIRDEKAVKKGVRAYRKTGALNHLYRTLFLNSFITGAYRSDFLGSSRGFVAPAIDCIATILAIEATLHGSSLFGRLFPKERFRDSAMLPELIYHEVTHVALADRIEIAHASPIGEGIANYLASRMLEYPLLSAPSSYAKGIRPRDGRMTSGGYHPRFDTPEYAQSDYAFQLLWRIDRAFGEDADTLFRLALSRLNSRSTLRTGVPQAFLEAANELPGGETWKIRLHRVFSEMGLP